MVLNRLLAILLAVGCAAASQAIIVRISKQAGSTERFAAREVARYFYCRTGQLPTISESPGVGIVVARKDRLAVKLDPATAKTVKALKPQKYLLKTIGKDQIVIVGGDDSGVLYGAYRLAEKLGVRFYLHGDTIPDGFLAPALPKLNEVGNPLFDIRGINPFHDFPEGPDWWSEDDYLAYIGQLAKMRMNFIGLHCYPEGGVGPEPLVWLGTQNKPRQGYKSYWANTSRNTTWGYSAMKTSELTGGASQLFTDDWYGPDTIKPANDPMEVFDRAGALLNKAFSFARKLGVKTCIGTETPLTIPAAVKEANPGATASDIYKGAFEHIKNTFPLDYYWLWTPEDWTWSGNKPEQYKSTVDDMLSAYEAIKSINAPFRLATCGWVLGPVNNRAQLDADLPKDIPLSAINQEVGNAPVDPAFGKLSNRPRWAIPWMENDPELTSPQIWVGRMRYDAADALRYGCNGLIGIHWRTKAMAMNVSALAAAGWSQNWNTIKPEEQGKDGALGGSIVSYTDPIEGTDEDTIYQSVRFNMDAYHYHVPNGNYKIRLMFNDPAYGEVEKRVFDVRIQGEKVISRLDIFERAGKNTALDYSFDATVSDGVLRIDFGKVIEYPCIAGIEIKGMGKDIKVNCGGPKEGDWLEDTAGSALKSITRTADILDYFTDFCKANFGLEAAKDIAKVLAGIDGVKLEKPAMWSNGPGTVKVEALTEAQFKERYAFVEALRQLKARIVGRGNLERFQYWLRSFELMREMARVGMLRAKLDANLANMTEGVIAAIKIRTDLTKAWQAMIEKAIETVDTPGELGTLFNLESQSRITARMLTRSDEALSQATGGSLPDETQLSNEYRGPARLIVPTVRTSVQPGEQMKLKAIVLHKSGTEVGAPQLHWRALGSGQYAAVPLHHVGRSVYEVALPAVPKGAIGIEYYITASAGEQKLVYPATAPVQNQTVVVGP